jgi:hypothetical protein
MKPDNYTSKHENRNAIVIVLLILLASVFADIGTRVMS